MPRLAIFAVPLALLAAAASAQPTSPGPPLGALARAVAATQAAKTEYAFDLLLQSPEMSWRAHYNPAGSPALVLIEPRREELGDNQRRAFERAAERLEGLSWCASEEMGHVADLRLVREDSATMTYAFQPTRDSVRGDMARSFANRLHGEVTVTKNDPDIIAVRIFAPRGFSPAPLTRLDALTIAIRCTPAPNGRRYAAESISDVRGSAFGQAFNEHSVQRFENIAAPP